MSKEKVLQFWTGEFGDEYSIRHKTSKARLDILIPFWGHLLREAPPLKSILEVGANVGDNLRAIKEIDSDIDLYAVEPNASAAMQMSSIPSVGVVGKNIWDISLPDNYVDLVFTSGVLVHSPPEDLLDACKEIHRVSREFIISIEYFCDTPTEVEYRGNSGVLWKRDFGKFWLDNFDVECLSYEFLWEPITGMDNVTLWLFRKTNETG